MPVITSAAPAVAIAAPAPQRRADIVVTGRTTPPAKPAGPASTSSIDADRIGRTINALTVEDTLKYLPSLLVRQRHPGDTQAPLATRTGGVGASARSLIYADGQLLSALIGNNNTIASPRWGLVSPQEIARIDVLYGPFAAAYPGNSIGAVVNITTRQPDRLEASVSAETSVGRFEQYGERLTTPTYRIGATLGDRFGPLSLFGSVDRLTGDAQPLIYVTAAPTTTAARPATGGVDALTRTGGAIRVLGSGGAEHNAITRAKLKVALDVTSGVRLTYTAALFLNRTRGLARSYLTDTASGLPGDGGTYRLDGRSFALGAAALSAGRYSFRERHWSHALSATGTGERLDWQVIGTSYRYGDDTQRTPTVPLNQAEAGGAGTIQHLDGTGWRTLDGRVTYKSDAHRLSAGAHGDWYRLNSRRYLTTDWIGGGEGALDLVSQGRTRTAALWAEDAWRPAEPVTLTLGARYEWWRAYDGANLARSPAVSATQPRLRADKLSPKATLAFAHDGWTLRASAGQAWRFPTVAELYQVVTTPIAAIPNPNLRPERARSAELAVEHRGDGGSIRVALFDERIRDALLSQTAALPNATAVASFVQNIGRTRVRGVEAAADIVNLVPRFDLQASVTYADARTRADAAFPAAVGKRLPQVPRWRGTLVATWRPVDALSLTAAGRVASRSFGTLDNVDTVSGTYQAFDGYALADLRAQWRVGRYAFGLGVDNIGAARYFLFHPFPQRTFHADVKWVL